MAWTSPATVGGGQLIDAAWMNTYLRDNLNALSTHTHDGAPGGGTAELAGVDSVTTDDIADPSAPGAGKTVIWTNSGKLHQRAGAAGTAEEIEVTGHTH